MNEHVFSDLPDLYWDVLALPGYTRPSVWVTILEPAFPKWFDLKCQLMCLFLEPQEKLAA